MAVASVPGFSPFDPTTKLWKDYWARFDIFAWTNSIPDKKMAQVFLTNQTATTYKLLGTLVGQPAMPKRLNELTMDEIQGFLQEQYDPRWFVVQERYNFW